MPFRPAAASISALETVIETGCFISEASPAKNKTFMKGFVCTTARASRA